MAIVEEQQCLLEEAQLRIPTPQTSAAKSASDAENYVGARPKITQRVTIRSPQAEAIPVSNIRKDQEIGTCAALLSDKVFNIVPSTVNVTWGTAWTRKVVSNEGNEGYNSQRLPQVPDTPMARGGVSSVTFKDQCHLLLIRGCILQQ